MSELGLMPNGNRTLGNWIFAATEDYAAARCCLLHGLRSGFILGQQAIEKLLKFYVQAAHPFHSPKRLIGPDSRYLQPGALPVNGGHDLVALAHIVDAAFPGFELIKNHYSILERLSLRFEGKYPDSSVPLGNSATSEIDEIDAVMIPLLTEIPVDSSLKWRLGIYAACWSMVTPDRATFPWNTWLLARNLAFVRRQSEILATVRAGMGH